MQSSLVNMDLETAEDTFRLLFTQEVMEEDRLTEDEAEEIENGWTIPIDDYNGWSKAKKHGLTKQMMFGNEHDEFELLQSSMDISKREKLAEILVLEKHLNLDSEKINGLHNTCLKLGVDPLQKLMQPESDMFLNMMMQLQICEKQAEEKRQRKKNEKKKKKEEEEEKQAESEEPIELRKGNVLKCLYQNGDYYPCTLVEEDIDGKWTVNWKDGGSDDRIGHPENHFRDIFAPDDSNGMELEENENQNNEENLSKKNGEQMKQNFRLVLGEEKENEENWEPNQQKQTQKNDDETSGGGVLIPRRKRKRIAKIVTTTTADERKHGYNLDGSKRAKNIRLDVAMKDTKNKTGWSEARMKAFVQCESNPNSYYYRFNKPGEKSKMGRWEEHEYKLFMGHLQLRGTNNKWGPFSINIPGRVGYTCSQFYRKLLRKGWIWDKNYWWDGSKFKFLNSKYAKNISAVEHAKLEKYGFVVLHDPSGTFAETPSFHSKCTPEFQSKFKEHEMLKKESQKRKNLTYADLVSTGKRTPVIMPRAAYDHVEYFPDENPKLNKRKKGSSEESSPRPKKKQKKNPTKPKPKTVKKTKRARRKREFIEESDEESYVPRPTRRRSKRRGNDGDDDYDPGSISLGGVDYNADNPIPDYMDACTFEPVRRPAISPYGHVLGMDTWTRILKNNTCPMTNQKLTRRMLTKLTKKNYDGYKDKIRHITNQEKENMSLFI